LSLPQATGILSRKLGWKDLRNTKQVKPNVNLCLIEPPPLKHTHTVSFLNSVDCYSEKCGCETICFIMVLLVRSLNTKVFKAKFGRCRFGYSYYNSYSKQNFILALGLLLQLHVEQHLV
jgi:hypothetical protein